MKQLERGFTLVELLIVIVIIGILAGITIVAYSGIQDRAKNTALLAAFDATEKALRIYKTINDDYPIPTDQPPVGGSIYVACINARLPAENGFALNQCSTSISPAYSESAILDTALKTVISPLPDTHSYSAASGGATYRGLIYEYLAKTAYLLYVVNGNQACGRGQALPNGTGGTVCQLILN